MREIFRFTDDQLWGDSKEEVGEVSGKVSSWLQAATNLEKCTIVGGLWMHTFTGSVGQR